MKCNKQKIVLKPDATPSIFRSEIGNEHQINTIETNISCPECVKKDEMFSNEKEKLHIQIEEMASEITSLRSKIEEQTSKFAELQKNYTKMRKKAYYLENTRTKLQETIKEIRQQNLINSELKNILEVFVNIFLLV